MAHLQANAVLQNTIQRQVDFPAHIYCSSLAKTLKNLSVGALCNIGIKEKDTHLPEVLKTSVLLAFLYAIK